MDVVGIVHLLVIPNRPEAVLCTDWAKSMGERGSSLAKHDKRVTVRFSSPCRLQKTAYVGFSSWPSRALSHTSSAIFVSLLSRRRTIAGTQEQDGDMDLGS